MLSFLSKIVNICADGKLPPVMAGAKAMIEEISAQEKRLAKLNQASPIKKYTMVREKQDIADLFTHCVSNDFYKDAYSFIKTA